MTFWDCIMVRDELDMLAMRLEETTWARTVLVESTVTHRGIPKPLHYLENEARFASYAVDHVVAPLPDDLNPWVREHAQRNAAWPVIDATFRYSIFLYGALTAHAPQYSAILQGLQVSDTTPYS